MRLFAFIAFLLFFLQASCVPLPHRDVDSYKKPRGILTAVRDDIFNGLKPGGPPSYTAKVLVTTGLATLAYGGGKIIYDKVEGKGDKDRGSGSTEGDQVEA
ncbi:hypothetical protein FRB99_005934 [Tulasnella sp. 403]|nr:hypothetical protein FRB99_005934 [Tulasnella sp. 403]